MKKTLCTLFVTLGLSVHAQMQLDLTTGILEKNNETTIPTRDIKKVPNGYEVTYCFHHATIIEDKLFPGTVFWKIDGFGLDDTPENAELLLRNDLFQAPLRSSCKVEVVDSCYIDYPYTLTPARQALSSNDDIGYTKENVKPIRPFCGFQPSSVVSLSNKEDCRNTSLFTAKICPIQYNYEQSIVRAYKTITYRITFENTSIDEVAEAHVEDAFLGDNIINNITLNPTPLEPTPGENLTTPAYLIISTPEFEPAVRKFATMKRMFGYKMHILLRDDWTDSLIITKVRDVYTSELYSPRSSRLKYLLIIGDHEDVPAMISYEGPRTHVTDYYYRCMTDSTTRPEIYGGRLPVSNLDEAMTVVNKIITYETTPPNNPTFYNKGVHCAYFQDLDSDGYADRRFAQTAEEIREYVIGQGRNVQRIYYTGNDNYPTNWNNGIYSYGEPIPTELLKPGFAWDGNTTDVISAINSGTMYVLHRDHGASYGWGSPTFYTEHISSLENGELQPIVFSMNCSTGEFDTSCFAEEFLKKANGGCIAIIAASNTSYSGYNDVLTAGIFDAIWPNPGLRPIFPSVTSTDNHAPMRLNSLGEVLQQGLERMSETYSSYLRTYTKEIFHCFGDPSLQIHRTQPTPFNSVTINQTRNRIEVSHQDHLANITIYDHDADSLICVYGLRAAYSSEDRLQVSVCISAPNKIPYFGGVPLFPIQFIEPLDNNSNYAPNLAADNEEYAEWAIAVKQSDAEIPVVKEFIAHELVNINGKIWNRITNKDFVQGQTSSPTSYGYRIADKRIMLYNFDTQMESVALDFNLSVGDKFTTYNGDTWIVKEVKDTLVIDNGPKICESNRILLKVVNTQTGKTDSWLEDFGSLSNHFMILPSDAIEESCTLWMYTNGTYVSQNFSYNQLFGHDTGWMEGHYDSTLPNEPVSSITYENGVLTFKDQRLWYPCRRYNFYYRQNDDIFLDKSWEFRPHVDGGGLSMQTITTVFDNLPEPVSGCYTLHYGQKDYSTDVYLPTTPITPNTILDLQGRPISHPKRREVYVEKGRKVVVQ